MRTVLLDAAARILEHKTFDGLTVAEVVQGAGASVGAFYGRIKDQDAFLLALDERFFEQFASGLYVMIFWPGWTMQPIPAMIRDVVEFMVDA